MSKHVSFFNFLSQTYQNQKHHHSNINAPTAPKKYKYRFIKGLIDDPECFKLIDQYIFPLIFYLYNEEAAYYDGSPILCCIELTFRHELCHCTFHWWCWTVSSLGCNNAILRQLEFSFRTKVNFS